MKSLSNIRPDKKIKKKLILAVLISLPFILIIMVILFRHNIVPTNEEIIEHLKNMKQYQAIVEYTITNTRGEYKEKAQVTYSKDEGAKIDFGEKLTKIYKNDSVIMRYNEKGEEYEVDKDLDILYPMAIMSESLKNPIYDIQEGQQEWGDLEYLKLDMDFISNNRHLDKACMYIDKKEKKPMLIKIYDTNGKERVKIEYREFVKQK